MNESRRKFLKTSACGLTGAAMLASMDKLNLVNAMVQQQPDVAADYKALVCIFLNGGTDCNNMVIPFDDYTIPAAVRPMGMTTCVPAPALPFPSRRWQTPRLLRRTPAAFLMRSTRTFHLRPTTPDRPKASWTFGTRASSRCCATLVLWFGQLRGRNTSRTSDVHINSFLTQTRSISK